MMAVLVVEWVQNSRVRTQIAHDPADTAELPEGDATEAPSMGSIVGTVDKEGGHHITIRRVKMGIILPMRQGHCGVSIMLPCCCCSEGGLFSLDPEGPLKDPSSEGTIALILQGSMEG